MHRILLTNIAKILNTKHAALLFIILFFNISTIWAAGSADKKHIVLAIDGGGVRGIIPARILQEIEQRTGRSMFELVDTVSGNSTGGIIALGLVTPDESGIKAKYKAQDFVSLYLTQSKDIFSRSVWSKIKTGNGLWGIKYDRENLDKILLGQFGHTTFSKALKDTLIFSYSLDREEAHLWSSEISKNKRKKDFYIKDIAAATSAAPTYFAPAKISNVSGDYCFKTKDENNLTQIVPICTEADGGIFANNPAIMVTAYVMKRNPHLKRENIILISLGTGQAISGKPISLHNNGMLNWLVDASIIDLILNSTTEVSEWTTSALGIEHYRIQVDLKENIALDDASTQNTHFLLNKAEEYIKNNNGRIQEICNILIK